MMSVLLREILPPLVFRGGREDLVFAPPGGVDYDRTFSEGVIYFAFFDVK